MILKAWCQGESAPRKVNLPRQSTQHRPEHTEISKNLTAHQEDDSHNLNCRAVGAAGDRRPHNSVPLREEKVAHGVFPQ